MEIIKFLIENNISIQDALRAIDLNGYGVVYITEGKKVIGVVTDGDIRRYILRTGKVNDEISQVANYRFKYMHVDCENSTSDFMKKNRILSVPILDDDGDLIRIEFLNGNSANYYEKLEIPVVIMAGGKGTRLYPYTEILPKPLIPIGERTITEHILERFKQYNCTDIKMIVNYKKKFIETYFQDEDTKYNIQFIEEEEFAGTAGGLRLLIPYVDQTFIMTNCDILLEANYVKIYEEHKKKNNIITMVCAEKKVEISYGIIEADDNGKVTGLKEKPVHSFMANTGFYMIEPEFLQQIPPNQFVHITDVIEKCINAGKNVGMYRVPENAWLDMGQLEEMEKMKIKLGV